ncbi:MAG: DNA primase noncatalytic subunit PriX [Candidatus Nitrosocosmicus sp.]|nr:DNA primase noncatalytic subunit PriX [Candidatus Nitrosocosmicus sp.]
MDHLIQIRLETDELRKENLNTNPIINGDKIAWIDKLLETPIPDHRYFCLWHILIPYLKNIKRLSNDEIIITISNWLDSCNLLNKIRWKYPQRIKYQLRNDKGFPPISLENLKKENFELYSLLQN